ncbi:MAG TPA: phage major capsid protein [Lacunisphaera sp.]|nr:phage major capsid protein [Lacunisphaera sp.]
MHQVTELRQRRARLVEDIRNIQQAAGNRALSSDDLSRIEKIEAECDNLAREIGIAERQESREKELVVSQGARVAGDEVHSDLGRYSILRALKIAVEGRSFNGLEREVHDELAKSQPEAARGILVPLGLQMRDMTALGSSGAEGGYTIATNKASLLDVLRAKLILRKLGASVFTGLVGNFDLPRGNAGAAAGWKAEGTALDESSQTVAQLALKPKRLGTFTEITRQLLSQSSSDVEAWVRNDLIGAISTALESAAIAGDGSGSTPTGILSTASIGDVAGGTNGLAPTWAHIVALEAAVANVNADAGTMGYLVNTKTRGKLKTTLRNPSGTDGTFVWPDDSRLNGYNTGVSNVAPSNLDKGTSVGVCSAIIFANWADLVLAQWGNAIDILANPYSKDVEGIVRITASTFADAGVRRPESFAAMKDALTA